MEEDELKDFKKRIESYVRTCYGAISSLQTQLHHLCGIIEETHGLTEEALIDIRDMDLELKKIREILNE